MHALGVALLDEAPVGAQLGQLRGAHLVVAARVERHARAQDALRLPPAALALHKVRVVLVGRRLSLPDELRSELLSALAVCDTQIRSTMHARIPFENFLHKAATSGRKHGLAFG